jgi:hypothetical protein
MVRDLLGMSAYELDDLAAGSSSDLCKEAGLKVQRVEKRPSAVGCYGLGNARSGRGAILMTARQL